VDGSQSTVKDRKVGSPVSASTNADAALFYDQFRRHAQRFVSLVERGEALPTRSFLVEVATALAELCAVALTLPDIESETHTKPDVEIATPSVVKTLRNRLGKADEHWEVFDPTKKDEPLKRSLAEDIANIYGDLKHGLLLTAHGASTSEVLSHWRQAFSTHWGMHATGAMRAIYWALHHGVLETEHTAEATAPIPTPAHSR